MKVNSETRYIRLKFKTIFMFRKKKSQHFQIKSWKWSEESGEERVHSNCLTDRKIKKDIETKM